MPVLVVDMIDEEVEEDGYDEHGWDLDANHYQTPYYCADVVEEDVDDERISISHCFLVRHTCVH